MKIVILEDNAERQAIMRACIADRFYTFDAHIFDDAAEMVAYLEANLAAVTASCVVLRFRHRDLRCSHPVCASPGAALPACGPAPQSPASCPGGRYRRSRHERNMRYRS